MYDSVSYERMLVRCGGLRESILRPFLSFIHVNDSQNSASDPFSVYYADDINALARRKDMDERAHNLTNTWLTVSDW